MPVRGPKPKDEAGRRRLNAPVHDWTEVADVAWVGAPRLPRYRIGGRTWPLRTKAWWKAVSTMPHCALWSDSDWSFAIDTAMVAAEFHDGTVSAATELRQREKILGTTADARRDLRIRYVRVKSKEELESNVSQLNEYRALYGASDYRDLEGL